MSATHGWNRILLNLKQPTEGGRVAYPEEIEESLATALATIAGFLDAYGFITYNIYVSFMSGNTTRTGYETGQGNMAAAAHSALPIISFLGGSFAGALLAHSSVHRIRRLVFGMNRRLAGPDHRLHATRLVIRLG